MPAASDKPLAPLKQPLFRSILVVALIADIGDWMQSVAAGWLMTSLTSSPTIVALVQAATNLPTFVLSLPGGALADVVDRKRLLSITTIWMMVFAAILAVSTVAGTINAWGLLAFTLLIGAGAALEAPAWQAITSELVPREDLQAAVALNTAEFNIARAIGPAFGGLLVAAAGAGVNFLVNAVSFLVVLIVLCRWHRPRRESSLPAEHFQGAMRAGIRYVRHASVAKDVLARTFIFTICAAGLWALLPLIARNELHMDSLGYDVLLGILGVGALGGAYVLPSLRTKLSRDAVVVTGSTVFAGATLTLALLRNPLLVSILLFAGGAGWLVAVSQATSIMRTLQISDRPTKLAQAVAELGRIDKTIHALTYIDDETKRRRTLYQLNKGEDRHKLARTIFHGKQGRATPTVSGRPGRPIGRIGTRCKHHCAVEYDLHRRCADPASRRRLFRQGR